MDWYYIDESITDGERRQGPFSLDEIREFAAQEKIKAETLVWHTGEESWKPWKDYFESQSSETREEAIQNAIDMLLQEQRKMKLYGGFFSRLLAYVLDNLIISFIGGIILFIAANAGLIDLASLQALLLEYVESQGSNDVLNKMMADPGMSAFLTVWTILQAVYFIVFGAKWSSSPGKMLLHLRMETKDGEALTWSSSILRYIASVFTQFTLVFYGIGYLVVCIDPKRRALHDWIARTYVVYQDRSEKVSKKKKSGKAIGEDGGSQEN